MENLSELPEGKFVIAVSGGVDSVALLDILAKKKKLELVVAHFDHGIRENSADDNSFVAGLAKKYSKVFVCQAGNLGSGASEEIARNARYKFLRQVAQKNRALGIITAHHEDDVIETCLINLIRGTGRHGLSSLKNRPGIFRPLLRIPKKTIINYAKDNNLPWQEDPTNADPAYLRNKIRLQIIPKMTDKQRNQALELIANSDSLNIKIDQQMEHLHNRFLHKGQPVLSRKHFVKLDHIVSCELIYSLLRKFGFKDIDKKTIDRIVVQIKTLTPGKVINLSGGKIELTKRSARLIKNELSLKD